MASVSKTPQAQADLEAILEELTVQYSPMVEQ
jgi:hypothetical protein